MDDQLNLLTAGSLVSWLACLSWANLADELAIVVVVKVVVSSGRSSQVCSQRALSNATFSLRVARNKWPSKVNLQSSAKPRECSANYYHIDG